MINQKENGDIVGTTLIAIAAGASELAGAYDIAACDGS